MNSFHYSFVILYCSAFHYCNMPKQNHINQLYTLIWPTCCIVQFLFQLFSTSNSLTGNKTTEGGLFKEEFESETKFSKPAGEMRRKEGCGYLEGERWGCSVVEVEESKEKQDNLIKAFESELYLHPAVPVFGCGRLWLWTWRKGSQIPLDMRKVRKCVCVCICVSMCVSIHHHLTFSVSLLPAHTQMD